MISTLYRQTSERGFDSLLSAHLFNLIGSVGVTEAGSLTGSPNLGDLRFSEPESGWYWAVEPVPAGLTGELRSPSMTDGHPVAAGQRSALQRRVPAQLSDATDRPARRLKVIESEFELESQNRVARFRVMGNRTELEDEIAGFERRLFTYLGAVRRRHDRHQCGRHPARPAGRSTGCAARWRWCARAPPSGSTAAFPAEIEPLANETNALIENNRRIVERSRTQVGNLAHSLKTPLAVLLNEGRALGGEKGRLIVDQASAMQTQVEHYLQRARVAAQRDSVVYRTPVSAAPAAAGAGDREAEPHDKAVALTLPPTEVVFAGEREDLEEIVGNLLDNAMKWARSRVAISAQRACRPRPMRRDMFADRHRGRRAGHSRTTRRARR